MHAVGDVQKNRRAACPLEENATFPGPVEGSLHSGASAGPIIQEACAFDLNSISIDLFQMTLSGLDSSSVLNLNEIKRIFIGAKTESRNAADRPDRAVRTEF